MLCVCQTLARAAREEALRFPSDSSLDGHSWDGAIGWSALVLKPELKPFGSLRPFKSVLSDRAVTEQIDR